MQTGDFLLCTFSGDTASPPTNHAMEILAVDTALGNLECFLSETGQTFAFQYASEPWTGIESGQSYNLSSHEVYSPLGDPQTGHTAIVTFDDGVRLLAYVNNTNPQVDLSFYYGSAPQIVLDGNRIVQSNWDVYPQDGYVISVEGCVAVAAAASGSSGTGTASSGSAPMGEPLYQFLPVDWLDNTTTKAQRDGWIQSSVASKTFLPDEPANNIDQLPIPPWIDTDKFRDSFLAFHGEAAKTIVGDWSKPVTASYFVIHDTAGAKEPNTSGYENNTKLTGIHLFIGTQKTVYRPHRNNVRNDFHITGSGSRVPSLRPEEFIQIELSPSMNYDQLPKQEYADSLLIGIDGVQNAGTNFTIRQYELLALSYLVCCFRKGSFLTVTTHREVDFSWHKDAHGDPKDFDFGYFYGLICHFTGLENYTFGIQHDRAYEFKQVNRGGYVNDFYAYVQKKVDKADQYGMHTRFPGQDYYRN